MKEKKSLSKTFVVQQDQSDCGVACLLSVINYNGGRKSLEQLRELSGTSKQGTTILGLYQSSQKCGFNAEGLEVGIEWLKKNETPVILHVILDNSMQHYVVCYRFNSGKFIIGDPAKGIVKYTEQELEAIWRSKALLKLTPNSSFEKVQKEKKNKIKWFKQIIEEDKSLLGIIFILSLMVSALGLGMAIYSQKLIDVILPEKDYEKIILGTILLLTLLIARSGLSYLTGFFGITQSKGFNIRLIGSFYSSLLFLPKSFFDNRRVGELVARMDDTSRIQIAITQVVMELLMNFLLVVVGLVVLFVYSGIIGTIVISSLPIFAFISFKYHKNIVNAQQEVMSANSHKTSNYINTMECVSSIKTQNKENIFTNINQLIYGHFQDKIFHLGKLGISIQALADIVGVIITIGVLGLGSWLVVSTSMSTGTLMAVLGITGSLFPAIASLAFANITLQGAKVAFNRMYEFATINPEYNIQEERTTIDISFKSLELENVSYRFPGRKQILSNINLSLSKGEVVAILGESGGGKTTLLNILQGFYKPESGKTFLNNSNLDNVFPPDYRHILGVVPQEASIFNGTLMDNLCMGGDENEVNRCIEFCQKHEFDKYFSLFPQSYSTMLGEEGINISGGQKQLISLCRALTKKPSLLLLDEPTSAMDRNTENFALSVLNKFREKCGIILVTHQLKIANKADKIYILQNNTIEISGAKETLMKTDNLYSQMYNEIHFKEELSKN